MYNLIKYGTRGEVVSNQDFNYLHTANRMAKVSKHNLLSKETYFYEKGKIVLIEIEFIDYSVSVIRKVDNAKR